MAVLVASGHPAPGRSMLRGRDDARAVLDRLLEEARAGQSGVLVLRGEAGVGKTALLEYAIASASDLMVVRAVGEFYLRTRQPQKAVPYFRKILNPELKAPNDLVNEVALQLARVLATDGRYPQFREALARGDFAVHWEAHGHCYALPRAIDDDISAEFDRAGSQS